MAVPCGDDIRDPFKRPRHVVRLASVQKQRIEGRVPKHSFRAKSVVVTGRHRRGRWDAGAELEVKKTHSFSNGDQSTHNEEGHPVGP